MKFSQHIFKKRSYIIFQENPSSRCQVVPCGQTDRHEEANICFLQFCAHPKTAYIPVLWFLENREGFPSILQLFHSDLQQFGLHFPIYVWKSHRARSRKCADHKTLIIILTPNFTTFMGAPAVWEQAVFLEEYIMAFPFVSH